MTPDAAIGPAWIDFPLSDPQGPSSELPTVRPFGLRYKAEPHEVANVTWNDLSYDAARQIAVVNDPDGVIVPAMKHTSTKTKTTSNSADRNPPDDDEDWTGS
jgi:putative ATP-grasp target RiPP